MSHRPPAVGVASRAAALDLLAAVLDRQRPLDSALAEVPALDRLDRSDRAFARLLVSTALRRLGQIDGLIADCVARPLPRKARAVQHILRLGATQIGFLETPPHAAVSSAVDLAVARGHAAHKGLVNAVLRRLTREAPARLADQDAARANTPDWLWHAWSAAHGAATARRIAEAHLAEPPLDLTVRAEADAWADRLDAARLPTGTLRRAGAAAVRELPGYAEGAWWVQDAAAALPARLLLSALDAPTASAVADLCAAPGGKTAQLAAAGARVTAVDRDAARMAWLRDNLARLRLEADLEVADATAWRPAAPLDAVLLDAPCTATGTIRRHPDVARLKRPDDVARLAAVQAGLLRHAASLVRPGGILVYATCSLQPEEGPAQADAFLAGDSGREFERLAVCADELAGRGELIDPRGDLRTLPCHLADFGGLDGFYAVRLRRRPAG